jgi:hypothetical protein
MRIALFTLLVLPAIAAGAPLQRLTDFRLPDQHGKTRVCRFPKRNVTVLTLADRKGFEQLEPWISAVYQRFGKRIDIDGVADVSSVPSPLRGLIRATFRQRLSYSVMLDWNGDVAHKLRYLKGVANVYVINREGIVINRFSGRANTRALHELVRAIDQANAATSGE